MTDLIEAIRARVIRDAAANKEQDPPNPPVKATELEAFEASFGFKLPELLRRLYTEVGDGGFGPEYGFLTVRAVEPWYQSMPLRLKAALEPGDDPDELKSVWRPGLLPLAYWGCDIYSLVDCADPAAPVLRFDGDYHVFQLESGETPTWQLEAPSLEAWLRGWLEGRVEFDLPEAAQS